MKWILNKAAIMGIIALAIALNQTTANAQQHRVTASLNFSEYDVIYLTDFVDVRSQQLNPNISGISLSLSTDTSTLWVAVYVEVYVQLQGDLSSDLLVWAYTNNFKINGSRTLAARDFAQNGGSDVELRNGSGNYHENGTLRTRLQDLANTNPTAPPGIYTVKMLVLPATRLSNGDVDPNDRATPNKNNPIGGDTKTVSIQLSNPDQVQVDINDPRNGSYFSNLAPTFSWTSGSSKVILSVFEAMPNHRSPQDALTGGNPCLVRELSGLYSLTYPSDAQRQLQQDKAYIVQVKARVITNRGENDRASIPFVFRITNDNVGQMLDNFLSGVGGSANATYSTLRADPSNWVAWSTYGRMTLDGSTLSETDLQTLLNSLTSQPNLQVQLSVENQ